MKTQELITERVWEFSKRYIKCKTDKEKRALLENFKFPRIFEDDNEVPDTISIQLTKNKQPRKQINTSVFPH